MSRYRPPRVPYNYRNCPQFQWAQNYGPRPPRAPFHSGDGNPRQNYRAQSMGTQHRNEEYWCETCDRGFPTKDLLENHKQQHQKCNIDGCQFVAHPKVITKHIQMQHSTGLFKKIGNINNPEEISKWREERKKKYPTKLNVEKKAAEIKEKMERGEKMGLTHDKNKRNHQSSDKGLKRKHPFVRNENKDKQKKIKQNFTNITEKSIFSKKNKVSPSLEVHRKLLPFAGIHDLFMDSDTEDHNTEPEQLDFFIEDDDDDSVTGVKKPIALHNSVISEPILCGALFSLIGDYGSSDEERDTEIKSTKVHNISQDDKKLLISRENYSNKKYATKQNNINKTNNESDNDSAPEEVKVVKNVETVEENAVNFKIKADKCKNSQINKQIKKSVVNRNSKSKIPSTLLQKLLHREILHERNIVLQCVRYIVKHDYFNKK